MLGETAISALRTLVQMLGLAPNHPYQHMASAHLVLLVEDFLSENNLKTFEELVEKVAGSEFWRHKFLTQCAIEDTELFRDPAYWRYLLEKVLVSIKSTYRVCFPDLVSGEELYSFMAACAVANCLDKVSVDCYVNDHARIENIRNGFVSGRNFTLNVENYKRWNPYGFVEDHFIVNMNKLYIKPELLLPVRFETNSFFEQAPNATYHLICYRNKMIYFTDQWQNQALAAFHQALKSNGLLSLGINENIRNSTNKFKFEEYFITESIYRRR